MKCFQLFALIISMLISVNLIAQQDQLINEQDIERITERLLANKKYLEENGIEKDGVITYVPVKYHIIGKTDNSSAITIGNVLRMHCKLNEIFYTEDEGIQFYIKDGFNFIYDDIAYESHSTVAGDSILTSQKNPAAINVFIPKDANPPGTTIGTLQGYYSSVKDWIVIRKSSVNEDDLTAPRLMGYFFSLLNTFNGWEAEPWLFWSSTNGNQAFEFSPGGVLNEKMDGSNCEVAGDYICDTPPSYNFFETSSCDYMGGALDPNGEVVDPDEQNIMDVFDESCTPKSFTQGQKEIMLADYENRPELQSTWGPLATTLTGFPFLIEPVDLSTTPSYQSVSFSWAPVEGADQYLLEIDRISDFSFNPSNFIVSDTQVEITGIFEADKNYVWRVTPFNAYNTCDSSSGIAEFTTPIASSSENVIGINDWTIAPNPVIINNMMFTIGVEFAFDAEVSIVTTTGQILQTKLHHFPVGNTVFEMSVNNIPTGIYIVNLKSGDRLINKKIIIAK